MHPEGYWSNKDEMRLRLNCLIAIIIVSGLLLSACSSGSSGNPQTTYEISPSFREFYQKLGGEDVLGPAISEKFALDSYECQYTVSVLICLNPQSTNSDRLFFYPLGDSLGLREDPGGSPAQSGSMVIDGYTVYDEFISLYDRLGQQLVGKPITQAHINYSQHRVEQFFENVGFYRKFSGSGTEVHLLAYGAYSCDSRCSYTPQVDASILNTSRASQDQPLLAGLSGLVDTSILGDPLTQPYIAKDGMEEQVYENAVIYAPVDDLSKAKLRPLCTLLDIPQTEPGTRKYSSSDGMVFYPTQGSKGYHVPLVFDDFIAAHGGMDYSGNPIDEVYQYSDTVYRQCFQNYCLDYDATAADGSRVRLAALGVQYLQQISSGESSTSTQSVEPTTGSVRLTVGESSNTIRRGDSQEIEILVTQRDDGQPVSNVTASLTIFLPDGSQMTASFPATGLDGYSSVTVPAMEKVANGTILEYRVCLDDIPGDPVCVTDSFLIWSE